MYKIVYEDEKKKNIKGIYDSDNNKIEPLFEGWTEKDFIENNIISVEPMTAKAYKNQEELEKQLTSTDYICEEKLDGVRAILILGEKNRIFSRRLSKKTNWKAENTDSLPHIRDLKVDKSLYGTVLDGELLIKGKGFKEIASLMNCKWKLAIERQTNIGFATLNVFDIIYYNNKSVKEYPLIERKKMLKEVVDKLNTEYIKEVPYTDNTIDVNGETLTKEEWYYHIVKNGGEGVMLKDKNGLYKEKRGYEYTKWKKYDTYDLVILGFGDPCTEYTGKYKDKWKYWGVFENGNLVNKFKCDREKINVDTSKYEVLPITSHKYYNLIGTIIYGLRISEEELSYIIDNKIFKDITVHYIQGLEFLVMGECSGMSESDRIYFTRYKDDLMFKVIEVGANDIIKDSGKLRHPRFVRMREDKTCDTCLLREHIKIF